MHIVSTNFTKTLVWKTEYDFKLRRHKQRTPNTNDHHKPLNETPPWKFSAYATAHCVWISCLFIQTIPSPLLIRNYINTCSIYGCLQLITNPTRITPTGCTIIDHIYTNFPTEKLTPDILINDLSDHLPVLVFIKSTPLQNMQVKKVYQAWLLHVWLRNFCN